MAKTPRIAELTRRERQVMNILHRRGAATVGEIMDDLPDPPTYSAVRSILRILSEKALVRHREDGPRYVYLPAESTERVRKNALEHVVDTYFAGSSEIGDARAVGPLRDDASQGAKQDRAPSTAARIVEGW